MNGSIFKLTVKNVCYTYFLISSFQMNIVVGNGTSPTSATASLSGTSQNSLNSESGNGGRGSPRLKVVEAMLAKKETAVDMILQNPKQQSSQVAMSESSDTTATTAASVSSTAPIATIEGHDDTDLKLDGGEVTKNKVTSPPSCTRLDDQGQACV